MQKSELTVFFDDPFWVGVYTRACDGSMTACKITFGAEPKDYDVYDYILQSWHTLRFSPAVDADMERERRINPKRMQRQVKRQVAATGVGTKAQQALKAQQAEGKAARQKKSKDMREAERQHAFELRQQKRKAKHRGH